MKNYRVKEVKQKLRRDGKVDNFPKGAQETDHTFRTDKKLRDNEEMFRLPTDEILPGPHITPEMENLPSKCCRLAFHMSKEMIATIYRVHGEGIEYYNGSQPANRDENDVLIHKADPDFGFDMQDRDGGFPCKALQADGSCGHHEPGLPSLESGKPYKCKHFPVNEPSLQVNTPITTCSYVFDEEGNRSGSCDGCKGALGL